MKKVEYVVQYKWHNDWVTYYDGIFLTEKTAIKEAKHRHTEFPTDKIRIIRRTITEEVVKLRNALKAASNG